MEDKKDEVAVLNIDIEQPQKEGNKQNNKGQGQQDKDDKKKTLKTFIITIIWTLLFIIILLLLILLGLKKCARDNNGILPNSGSEPDSFIKYDYDADKVDDLFKKIVSNQLSADGFDEDLLTNVIAVTYTDNQTSFNLNIEVRSETKVYYYQLSNHPYSGFDNSVPYLLSLDLDNPPHRTLNDGAITMETFYPSLETITTEKTSYKYLISTNYSGTDKFFSGFYYENDEYRAYIHKPLVEDSFKQNADFIVDANNLYMLLSKARHTSLMIKFYIISII